MESSRRWWIRPVLGTVLGLVVAALLVGAARGRAMPEPMEPTAIPPAAARAVEPADVYLAEDPAPESPPTRSSPVPGRAHEQPVDRRDDDEDDEGDEGRDDDGKDRREGTPKPTQNSTSKPTPAPKPTPQPTPACAPTPRLPALKLGWLGNLRDDRIDESSGLAMSARHPDLAYTMNDEGESPQIFGVRPSTGRTVSAFDLSGAGDFKDPESIRLDARGRVWLADTGDGHPDKPGKKNGRPSRDHVTIAVFDEPKVGQRGSVRASRHEVVFSNGPHNVEALAIHPRTGQAFLISSAKVGRVYRLSNPLDHGRNVARATAHRMPAFVTDATFTRDGRFVLIRTMQKPEVLVFDAKTWRRVGSFVAPRVEKGESITVEPNGQTVLLGSEGRNSPLIRLALPRFAQSSAALKSRC